MERLTRYGDIYNRLAELEDKLEAGMLVEIKPLNMPKWEEVQKKVEMHMGKVKINCNYGRIYIDKDENYMALYKGGDCHSFAYTKRNYGYICDILITYRERLIKELCRE